MNTVMQAAKTIIKNSIWLILGEVISKIAVFILVIIIARNFTIASFGKYNLAMAFVMVFSVINDLGLNIFLFRELARNKDCLNTYVGNVFLMRIVLSCIFFSIIFVCSKFFKYSVDTYQLLYLLALWNAVTSLTYVFRTVYKSMERMKWDVIINLLDNIVRLLIVIVSVPYGLTVLKLGFAYVASSLMALSCSIIVYRKYFGLLRFKINFSVWKTALKEMRFLALAAMLIPLFGKFDSIILSHYKGNEVVGLYSAALKLVWMLILIPSLVTQASFPKLSQYAFNEINKFNILISSLIKASMILTIITSTIIFFFASPIIFLVYGGEYFISIRILKILIWCFPLYGINTIFIYGLNAKNKQKVNSAFIGVCIAVNTFLSLVFVNKFSYIGVSFATLTSLFLLCCMYITYYFRNSYLCFEGLRFKLDDLRKIRFIFLNSV